MAEFITILTDLGLGLLAYRLAFQNRARIATAEARLDKHENMLYNIYRRLNIID